MRKSTAGTALLLLLAVSCARESASPFQPTLEAARRVAREHHDGDVVVFVSDASASSRDVRARVFGPTPVGQFIAAHFASVEVALGSDAAREVLERYRAPRHQAQIIIASERLHNLRIHVLRLHDIREQRLLAQLRRVKEARTIDEYRRGTGDGRRETGLR